MSLEFSDFIAHCHGMDAITWLQIVTAVLCANGLSYLFMRALLRSMQHDMDKQPVSVLLTLFLIPAVGAFAVYMLTV